MFCFSNGAHKNVIIIFFRCPVHRRVAAAAAAVIPRQPTNAINHRRAATSRNGRWPSRTEMEARGRDHPHPRPSRRKTPAAPTRRRWRTTTTIQAAIHRKMVLARIILEGGWQAYRPVASAGVAVAVAQGKNSYYMRAIIWNIMQTFEHNTDYTIFISFR